MALTLGGTASATAAGALTVNGDVTVGNGTTFVTGAFTHNFKGNFTNNGTFTASASSVVAFSGTSAQTIGGANGTGFVGLTVNNSAGVSLLRRDRQRDGQRRPDPDRWAPSPPARTS